MPFTQAASRGDGGVCGEFAHLDFHGAWEAARSSRWEDEQGEFFVEAIESTRERAGADEVGDYVAPPAQKAR
jgi:hypothetical protein